MIKIFLCALLLLCASSTAFAQFNYRSVALVNDVTLNGNATKLDDRIRLVSTEQNQRGSCWFNGKQRVSDGFDVTFAFQITDPGGHSGVVAGADGIAFVLQNSSLFEGGIGGGIGYEGIKNSLAVEFDVFDNTPWEFPEPDANHVSVQSQGRNANLATHSLWMGWTPNIPDLKAGAKHTARVQYTPGTLTVFVDDLVRPVLTVPVRLDSLLSLDEGKCWIGFTSATGGAWANFDLFSIQSEVAINIRYILFDFDKATLKQGSTGALDTLAMVLQKDLTLNAQIEGHTDNKGSDEYNAKLSQGRAASVKAYLVKKGIAAARLQSIGHGATVPVANNETEDGRSENRRVVAKLFVP